MTGFIKNTVRPSALYSIATAYSARNLDPLRFCGVIKLGTFCRTVVWPILPVLMFYQYIRQKDADMYAVDLLKTRSRSSGMSQGILLLNLDARAFYDPSKPAGSGHWRLQNDLELIRARANDVAAE